MWVRHNTFMRINMKLINQHILVMMTLHMTLTFIHVRSTQYACVSKLSTDVMITKHSLVDQKYCPDVSNCISSAITHMAPLCNPRQRDGWRHMTPWGGHTRLIGSGDISYKGASAGTSHFDLQSLNNHTQPPKSLIKSEEMFPNFISYLLVNHTQSVKPLHVSEEENHHKLKCTSPRVPNDKGVGNDTTGDMCHWLPKDGLLPHHNQCPEIHDKMCEVSMPTLADSIPASACSMET